MLDQNRKLWSRKQEVRRSRLKSPFVFCFFNLKKSLIRRMLLCQTLYVHPIQSLFFSHEALKWSEFSLNVQYSKEHSPTQVYTVCRRSVSGGERCRSNVPSCMETVCTIWPAQRPSLYLSWTWGYRSSVWCHTYGASLSHVQGPITIVFLDWLRSWGSAVRGQVWCLQWRTADLPSGK